MNKSQYPDDTTIDDIQSGDQLSMTCECGWSGEIAWALLPQKQKFTPLRDLRRKMVCRRCGARSPRVVIKGFQGPGSALYTRWTWPPVA
ncbi:hypothetical protein GCM10017620_26050 [Brevundimonas intermedia]|uniref:Uncharacterized protein n=1 Tax=Brevundimonas intermedia TaxID=74315 RepID=A0ABQ5TBV6_9CAUL|nr:hypothetical protein [Brevundimonas intermedia]GLK49632.1 hypothetical protein GCM10017620_26050 [Brevundimonas intermedia]